VPAHGNAVERSCGSPGSGHAVIALNVRGRRRTPGGSCVSATTVVRVPRFIEHPQPNPCAVFRGIKYSQRSNTSRVGHCASSWIVSPLCYIRYSERLWAQWNPG